MSEQSTLPDQAAPAPEAGAYRVLARTWRPKRFADLIGQDALVRTLTNAFASGRLAHAFLLTGVRGVGKTTTARIIARALNCTGEDGKRTVPEAEPCGACDNCRAIAEDRHVDVIEMDAASRTGVDDIRELIDGVRYLPTMGRAKVYIIDEVHMLSNNAFNALLKTLEEPPAHVKFIFATTEARRIPVTVISRCQRFDLRRVDSEVLARHFTAIAKAEGAEIEADAVALIARAADGSVRDGLSLLDQAIGQRTESAIDAAMVRDMLGLADRTQVFDLFEAVMGGDIAGALDGLSAQYDAGADPIVVVQDLLELTHWLTRLKVTPEAAGDPGLPEAERVRGRAFAEKLDMAELARTWQILLKGLQEAQIAPAPLQAVEMLLVRLAHAADLPSPADLVRKLDKSAAAAPPPPTPKSDEASPPDRGPRAAVAVGAPAALEAPPAHAPRDDAAPAEQAPAEQAMADPRTFADAVQLFSERREPVLYAHLRQSARVVRFEPGRIEVALDGDAPPRLAADLGAHLSRWTGRRWVVAVSGAAGQSTLAEQADTARAARRAEAEKVPLVREILDAFPGAEITEVNDPTEKSAIDTGETGE